MNHPLPLGTMVVHSNQRWHRPGMSPTGQIIGAEGPYNDGSYEYTVLAGIEFSRQVGPDNPLIRETKWNSLAVRKPER